LTKVVKVSAYTAKKIIKKIKKRKVPEMRFYVEEEEEDVGEGLALQQP